MNNGELIIDNCRIRKAFGKGKAFIPFVTGGDPDIETTEKLIPAMAGAGADLIEIGIPFSDPIAEGEVIQAADARALAGGCTVDKLFGIVGRTRGKTDVPLLFMTYINPVFKYGGERFAAECASRGVDGVIIPDMPFEERGELKEVFRGNGVALISMIAPTSAGRAEMIAREAEGFLYCVSSLGVTGVREELGAEIGGLIGRVRRVSDIPCAVGFGISTPEQARYFSSMADGVIVGSAVVRLVAKYGRNCVEPIKNYVAEMKDAVNKL